MEFEILFSEDPGFVLARAGSFLSSEPVLHNLILTILHARVARQESGRYWIARLHGGIRGVVVQSPVTFPALLTPMEVPAAAALADAIADTGYRLPGVTADAATAAAFAGQWSERSKSGATPFQGLRLYEFCVMDDIPAKVEGVLRRADARERGLMIDWTRAFQREIHESEEGTEVRVDLALAAGQVWLWELGGEPVTTVVSREPVHGVIRLAGVYTPPEKRKRGYAAACVHTLSQQLTKAGNRCILYTDLANPTSNSIYRRIGYRAVAEALRYRFD